MRHINWSSPSILFILIWGTFALVQTGYDKPDEHFFILEPVGRFLFDGNWTAPWEWSWGLRSWFPPLILTGFLAPFTALGIEDRFVLEKIARLFLVLWAFPSIWAVGKIAATLWPGEKEWARRAQVLWVCAWPVVIWGTRFGLDLFGVPPMLVGFAFLLDSQKRKLLIPAFCFAFAFCLRFTLAIPIIVGMVSLFWIQKGQFTWKHFLGVSCFGFLSLGVLSAGEAFFYQTFLGEIRIPFWEFFKFNVLKGSQQFHASVWYKLIGFTLLFWMPPFAFFLVKKSINRSFSSWWPLLIVGLTNFAFVFIRHKEDRFVLPLIAFSLLAVVPALSDRFYKLSLRVNGFLLCVALLLYSAPHYPYIWSLSQVSQWVKKDPELTVIYADSYRQTTVPAFYLYEKFKVDAISDEKWQQFCAEPIHEQGTPKAIVVSRRDCATPEARSRCRLEKKVPVTLGNRLRGLKKDLRVPRYIFFCHS